MGISIYIAMYIYICVVNGIPRKWSIFGTSISQTTGWDIDQGMDTRAQFLQTLFWPIFSRRPFFISPGDVW